MAALSKLEEEVAEVVKEASTFEKYRQEVLSGTLDWTPIHKDATFWRENVAKFDQQNHQVLRVVVKLMEVSREARTLAVACHDLSMFMQHHAHGKHIVQVRAAATAATPRLSLRPSPPSSPQRRSPRPLRRRSGIYLCALRCVALVHSLHRSTSNACHRSHRLVSPARLASAHHQRRLEWLDIAVFSLTEARW